MKLVHCNDVLYKVRGISILLLNIDCAYSAVSIVT
jgi:hypothetical protein